MRIGTSEIIILKWLTDHERATATEIGQACGLSAISVRGRLVILEKRMLVVGEPTGRVSRVKSYALTAEGRRAAGLYNEGLQNA